MKSDNDELQDILHDENIGPDVQTRKLRLAEAKRITRIVNVAGVAVAIWVLIPIPYDLAITVAMLFPIIPVFLLAKYKYLITIVDYSKSRVRPNISQALICPPVMLVIRGLHYDLINYFLCIVPAVILLMVTSGVFYLILPKMGKGVGKYDYFLLALMGLPYYYGSLVLLNCNYDTSKAVSYKTEVVRKYETGNKSTSYYLTIKKWEGVNSQKDVKVTSNEYDNTEPGQIVTISVKAGLLHIPWYYLN